MFIAFSLLLTLARAETVLRVPVFVNTESGPAPVAALNTKLSELGYDSPIAEWIDLDDGPAVRARIELVDARIEWARHVVGGIFGDSERAFEAAPGDLREAGLETCYRGDPEQIGDLAILFAEYMYSEHFGLWGWRNRRQSVLYEMSNETRTHVERNGPPLWKSRLRDDSILFLSRITPDGRDLHVSRVKKCE